jgi:plastocyanin
LVDGHSSWLLPYAAPKTHTVVIEAMQFSPQVLEVKVGDTVVWVNKDAFPHNAVATVPGFQSKEIASDGSWKFKAVKKGTFPYLCTLHPMMKASLVVK